MARPWRLRHKLLLGLSLVVGSIATLLAGTVQGLSSYVATMKTTDSKLSELQMAEELRAAVARLVAPGEPSAPPTEEPARMRQRLTDTAASLAKFVAQHQDTVRRHRDPDGGYQEDALIGKFEEFTRAFELAIGEAGGIQETTGQSKPMAEDAKVKEAHQKLTLTADELRRAIYDDMYARIAIAKVHQRRSMIIVITCSSIAMCLVAGLLYFFYGWVFYPIKRLQEGVRHVAEGQFGQPIHLKSGDELEELANAFNDMSARVQETYADLVRQVNERSRQLVRSERLVSVGFLAAGVAHENNNPLASIAFCGEAIERRMQDLYPRFPQDAETVHKYLTMIQSEAFRCKEITQKLLEFSRVGERRREPAELVELVQSVLEVAQLLQNCKGKQIVFQPYQRVTALVNGPDLKSVVLNLVVNGLDSMDEGGVLTITLVQRGPAAELVFCDSGCGMEADVLENIFEPFFTRSRTGKGTGLGLFISHQIISQHDGTIEATSEGPGQGSTFTVRVPLQPVVAAPVPPAETGPYGVWTGNVGTEAGPMEQRRAA